MKWFLLLSMFIIFSCSKNNESSKKPSSEIRRFEPMTVLSNDLNNIKAICNALESKEASLDVLVTSTYAFSYAQKSCSEEIVSGPKDVAVSIQRPDSHFIFRTSSGEPFSFPNVETASSGAMSPICASIVDLRSPIQTTGTGALWFTTSTSTSDCAADADHVCIQLTKGSLIEGHNYKVNTNEWIKFKVRGARRGFFVERKLISSADCAEGSFIERRATLK